MAELVMPAVVAPSTPVGRASPRKSQASTPPLLQSRAAAEKVAQLSSELKLSSELVEKLQALSSELAEKLAAVTVGSERSSPSSRGHFMLATDVLPFASRCRFAAPAPLAQPVHSSTSFLAAPERPLVMTKDA